MLDTFMTAALLVAILLFLGVWALFQIPEKKYKQALLQQEQEGRYVMRPSILIYLGFSTSYIIAWGALFLAVTAHIGWPRPLMAIPLVALWIWPLVLILRWVFTKVVVDGENITVCRLFFRRKKFCFSQITRMHKTPWGRLALFTGDKKTLTLDGHMLGHELFMQGLEGQDGASFSVSQPRQGAPVIVRPPLTLKWALLGTYLFFAVVGITLVSIIAYRDRISLHWAWAVLFLLLVCLPLVMVVVGIDFFRLRLTLLPNTLLVRRLWGESIYAYSQFTQVTLRQTYSQGGVPLEALTLCIGRRKIASATEAYPEYYSLREKLLAEDIPFYNE